MIAAGVVLGLCFALFSEMILAQVMRHSTNQGYNDASLVTWAHAVNSQQALEAELEGMVNFLEADVSLGHISGNEDGTPIPIMAHPPDTISDISLDRWLDIVISRESGKGVKLDFKTIDIVESSLKILQKHKAKIVFPLWLNADILPGPVSVHATPVLAEKFLALCQEYFPNATLSVGWTTYWLPSFPKKTWRYSWEHVREMVDTLKRFGNVYNTLVTFPVRGIFASRSIRQLKWLLEVFPQATLTVWSGRYDVLKLEDLKRIRESFPQSLVYYDIPGKLGNQFHDIKDEFKMKRPPVPTFVHHNYVKITKEQNNQSSTCSSNTYVTSETVVFGKDCETLVFLKEMFVVSEQTPLRIEGEVTFFGNESLTSLDEESHLVLALAKAKFFSKDTGLKEDGESEYDTNISWLALNSAQLHVFKHEKSSGSTSCHLFQLDTTAKNSFQAWTVDCDKLKEDRTAALNSGKPEISSRKRLVLPSGPLVFGMISSSERYIVVDNLTVKGGASGSECNSSSSKVFEVMFLCVVLACFSLLFSLFTE